MKRVEHSPQANIGTCCYLQSRREQTEREKSTIACLRGEHDVDACAHVRLRSIRVVVLRCICVYCMNVDVSARPNNRSHWVSIFSVCCALYSLFLPRSLVCVKVAPRSLGSGLRSACGRLSSPSEKNALAPMHPESLMGNRISTWRVCCRLQSVSPEGRHDRQHSLASRTPVGSRHNTSLASLALHPSLHAFDRKSMTTIRSLATLVNTYSV